MEKDFIVLTCPYCNKRVRCEARYLNRVLAGKARCPKCQARLQMVKGAVAEVTDDSTLGEDLPYRPGALLRVRRHEDIAVVHCQATALRDLSEISQFEQELRELVEVHGFKWIALNLGNLEYMSSAVVNALLQLNRKAAARRGGLMLCNLAPDVKKLLKLMRLDEILSVHKSEMDAVTALKKAR